MYNDGEKALMLLEDYRWVEKMENYLYFRYNLQMEPASDMLDIFNHVNNHEESYELVVIDENVNGLPTTSQALRTLKNHGVPNVMYLSTLHEISNPVYRTEMELLPKYMNHTFRYEQSNIKNENAFKMMEPIFSSRTYGDLYSNCCRTLTEVFNLDFALCVILRSDNRPVIRGILAATYPQLPGYSPVEIEMKENRYLRDMIDYSKPIHIPDSALEQEFCLDLLQQYALTFRSALVIPMEADGRCVGFLGMFTANRSRLFRITDIDLALGMAGIASAASINIVKTHTPDMSPYPAPYKISNRYYEMEADRW